MSDEPVLSTEELGRIVGSWHELNTYLSRCRFSDSVLPVLRHAVRTKARWPVIERAWQRYRVLSGSEERELLKLGVVPERLKEATT